jgi:trans-aconitate 2-methyltransferase
MHTNHGRYMKNTILNDDLLDLDAGHYVKHSSLQNSLAKKILSTYRLNPRAHILDVGCGDGRVTAELAKHVNQGKVLGIDASPGMIEFASMNYPKTKFPNLDFLQGMAEGIEFLQQFDLIVSFSCFHWLKDPKAVIRRLSSSLKPGGEMLILTYPKESPYYRYLQTALENYPEYYPLSANHAMLSASGYKKLFLKNHMQILDFQQQNLIASYNNSEEIQKYIKGWLNSYVNLPEHLHDSFLQSVSQAVFNDPTTHKGKKIGIPYTALVIKARKQ